ncbi:MAG: hypothetical protein ACU0CX_14145 [Sagittula sp.]|uniref:hypothetical protein n=1 Tax=Rhodobacterales TaxID=204455 RepID=UPI0040599546
MKAELAVAASTSNASSAGSAEVTQDVSIGFIKEFTPSGHRSIDTGAARTLLAFWINEPR